MHIAVFYGTGMCVCVCVRVGTASFSMSISHQALFVMIRAALHDMSRRSPVSRHTTVSLIHLGRHRFPRILEQSSNELLGKGGAPYANSPFASRSRARAAPAHAFEERSWIHTQTPTW
jgi:hypothetical protein